MSTRLRCLTAMALVLGCGAPTVEPQVQATPMAWRTNLEPTEVRFDLRWQAGTKAPDPMQPGEVAIGRLALDAQLVLDVAPALDEHQYAFASIEDVRRLEWTSMPPEATESAAALLDECGAWVDLAGGPPQALEVDGPLSQACEHVLTHVVVHVDLTAPSSDDPRTVIGAYGTGHARYVQRGGTVHRNVHGEGAEGLAFAGRSALELDAQGRPDALESAQWTDDGAAERGWGGRSALTLQRLASSSSERPSRIRPPMQVLQTIDLRQAVRGDHAKRDEALAYADGLDAQMLGLIVGGVDDGAKLEPGFAIRARGLLLAQPEVATKVGSVFEQARTTHARQLALDILANAGTPEAQEVLRTLIDREVDAEAEDRTALVQRLAMLERPDLESYRLALGQLGRAQRVNDSPMIQACLHLLGEVVRRGENVAPELESIAMTALRSSVDDPTAEIRAAAFAGIGNAGRQADLPRLLKAIAEEPDDAARSTAVLALRKIDDPVVDPTLRTLALDSSPLIADRASSALAMRDEIQLDSVID